MATNAKPVYKRILLKLSGEALQGTEGFGIDASILDRMAQEIKELVELGIQVGVVIGGGNLFRGAGLAKAGLVRLTLFASDMSKGTVSAAMGMLQMLIFTVGIEISKHAWLNGGNGLFNLFNLVNGILWLSLMVIFLKDKQMGNSHEG